MHTGSLMSRRKALLQCKGVDRQSRLNHSASS
jgi:hypothetical protein